MTWELYEKFKPNLLALIKMIQYTQIKKSIRCGAHIFTSSHTLEEYMFNNNYVFYHSSKQHLIKQWPAIITINS